MFFTSSSNQDLYFLRYAVSVTGTEADDVKYAWTVVVDVAEKLIRDQHST